MTCCWRFSVCRRLEGRRGWRLGTRWTAFWSVCPPLPPSVRHPSASAPPVAVNSGSSATPVQDAALNLLRAPTLLMLGPALNDTGPDMALSVSASALPMPYRDNNAYNNHPSPWNTYPGQEYRLGHDSDHTERDPRIPSTDTDTDTDTMIPIPSPAAEVTSVGPGSDTVSATSPAAELKFPAQSPRHPRRRSLSSQRGTPYQRRSAGSPSATQFTRQTTGQHVRCLHGGRAIIDRYYSVQMLQWRPAVRSGNFVSPSAAALRSGRCESTQPAGCH